jgi:hypothetical protein
MIVRKMDYDSRCFCGHKFENHHHGCVMNPEYFDYPLNVDGVIGQECEYNQRYGQYFPKRGEKPCRCANFRPSSKYIQQLVKEWHEKHPR